MRSLLPGLLLTVLAPLFAAAQTGTVKGRVVDARGGEPLSQVSVRLGDLRTVTNESGQFEIAGVPAGESVLTVSTVGYHAVKLPVRVEPAETRQFDLGLRTSTEVLDAQTKLADARSSEIAALTQYQIAQVDIAYATGNVLGATRVGWTPTPVSR